MHSLCPFAMGLLIRGGNNGRGVEGQMRSHRTLSRIKDENIPLLVGIELA